MTRRIEIVVDELVFRGLSPGAARTAAAGFEAALAELAASEAVVPPRAEASRRLPDVDTPVGGVGEAVAGAVWSALAPGAAR